LPRCAVRLSKRSGVLAVVTWSERQSRLRPNWPVWGGFALVLIVGAVCLTPVVFIIVNSFNVADPGRPWEFSIEGWKQAFSARQTLAAIGYTLILSVRSLIGIVIAFILSWLLVRFRLPGSRFVEMSLWIGFFLPPLPMALSWVLLLDRGYGIINQVLKPLGLTFDIYSVSGIIWVHLTTTIVPVMTILLIPALRQLDASMEEASRISGAGPWFTIRRILLPVLAPALLTVLLAGVIRGLEAFEVEQLLGTRVGIYVYATRIYDLIQSEPPDYPQAMALSTLFLGILFVLAMIYQWIVGRRRVATMSGRGVSFRPMELGKRRYLIAGLLIALVTIAIYLPCAILILGSFMKLFGFFKIANPFTFNQWATVLHDPDFTASLKNSIILGFSVAGIGVVLYSLLAYVLVRSSIRFKGLIGLLVWLPWAVPGILIGLSFLSLMLSVPGLSLLYGTYGALILVLFVKEMPIGVYMLNTAIAQISEELEQVGKVCGARWLFAYRRIVLPLLSPMLVSIFAITFMAAVKDIGTIVLLGGGSIKPLSLLMLSYTLSGEPQAAAIIGVILSGLGIAVALVSRRLGLRSGFGSH
jgi:iron(III) transport system permease protein